MSTAKNQRSDRSDRPDGAKPLTFENIEHLSVGRDGHLYWHGRQVETRARIGLTFWQRLGAFIVVLGALGGLSQGIDAGHNFGCKLRLWSLGCPKL